MRENGQLYNSKSKSKSKRNNKIKDLTHVRYSNRRFTAARSKEAKRLYLIILKYVNR